MLVAAMAPLKCDICLEEGGVISDSPFLSLLLQKHLGLQLFEKLFSCENCNKLVHLWDEFSQHAKMNLFVSHPKMQYKDVWQSSKLDELHENDDETKNSNEFQCTVSCADSISIAVWSELDNNPSTIQLEDLAPKTLVINADKSDIISSSQMSTMEFEQTRQCNLEEPKQENFEAAENFKNLEQGQEMEHGCTYCSEYFVCEQSLTHHIKQHHLAESQSQSPVMQTKLSCPICHGCLSTEFQMKQHIRLCHPSSEVNISNLQIHSDFVCKICNIDFISKQKLDNHKQLKHGEPKHRILIPVAKLNRKKCFVCNRTFSNRSSLMSHNRIYHNPVLNQSNKNSKFICKFCSKGFDRKPALYSHLRNHPEIRNKKDTSIFNKQYKKNDNEKVNDDKDVLCKVACSQKFRKENSIYHCNFCSKTDNSEIAIQKHMKESHHFKKVSKLNISSFKSFKNSKNQKGTKTNQTQEKCKPQLNSSTLKEYTRVGKKFKCNICCKIFTSSNGIDYHLHKHILGDNIKIDPKYFTKTHSNYKCNICDKLLSTSPGIQYHIRHAHLKLN